MDVRLWLKLLNELFGSGANITVGPYYNPALLLSLMV